EDGEGVERYGYAMVPVDARGVTVHDDWDGLGMRASGSNSVTFTEVELPAAALRGGFPAGDAAAYIERNLTPGLFHAPASLGIAEYAHEHAAASLARLNGSSDARSRLLLAEGAIELTAARGTISRAASLIDAHYADNPTDDGTESELADLFAETQAAKTFVNEAATRIVDRALASSGGAGYLSSSPLARAWRDVRAGQFMHPLGANRAYHYVASATLGQTAALR